MWERGLKSIELEKNVVAALVAPLVGAWIEMLYKDARVDQNIVAPLVGAWIEIPAPIPLSKRASSLPLWERGLKFKYAESLRNQASRSPCGSVD